jgi:hypothetical protein
LKKKSQDAEAGDILHFGKIQKGLHSRKKSLVNLSTPVKDWIKN